MTQKLISVLVVDDSALMRILLADILRAEDRINLIGTANNGKEGVEKALILKPDVIICDMIMPGHDGLHLVKTIMREKPTPVLLLSALDKSNSKIFEALQHGAFDFLEKPRTDMSNLIKSNCFPLIPMVKAATVFNAKGTQRSHVKPNNHKHNFDHKTAYEALLIGASTGGPGAIEHILKQLPGNLPFPVIIAQHMPASFIESFARRLDTISPFAVKVARKGEELNPGAVYIAPGTNNTLIKLNPDTGKAFFSYTNKVFKEFNNPSIDCLMLSAAEVFGSKLLGVILSGMGQDGKTGLMAIKNAGGITLVQDEATSVVYGMPKVAWEAGAAIRQVPIEQMAGFLISCF